MRHQSFYVYSDLEDEQSDGGAVKYTRKDINDWIYAVIKLHNKFQSGTSDTCNNTCIFKDWICKAKTSKQWEMKRTSRDLKAVPLLPKGEYTFPWDREYLSHKPLQDIKTLPDLRRSRVFYLWKGKSISDVKTVLAEKNEKLYFRVDLVDSYGKPRRYGGDEVRTWISDSKGNGSMSGIVKDLGNGTYLVMVTPKWPGLLQLHVTVTYPREAIRAALHQRREGRYRFMYGLYSSGDVDETTLCHTTPNIPGRACLCNHTDINRRPYYCGRPLDKSTYRTDCDQLLHVVYNLAGDGFRRIEYWIGRVVVSIEKLQCKHWAGYKGTGGPIAKDVTPAETAMLSTIARKPGNSEIQHDLIIQVGDKGKADHPIPPCIDLDRSITWNKKSPRGIWIDKNWNSFVCKEPEWTTSWVKKCLRSTHIWMIGDSNMKQMYNAIRDIGNAFDPTFDDWKGEIEGHNIENNSTLTFRGHEQPNFHYEGHRPLLGNGGIEDFLGKIHSNGNHNIVIIHYFLHFAISDLSAMFRNVLAIKDAVTALLVRNPSVLVGIRGPHTAAIGWKTNHIFGGDVLGSFMLSMMDAVFRDLHDKVVFLDGWDMTISVKNTGYHPPKSVPKAMLRTLFSFKCPGSL